MFFKLNVVLKTKIYNGYKVTIGRFLRNGRSIAKYDCTTLSKPRLEKLLKILLQLSATVPILLGRAIKS